MLISARTVLMLSLLASTLASKVKFDAHHRNKSYKKVNSVKPPASPSGSASIYDTQDLIYEAAITVGDQQFRVVLDTGSSDLWVKAKPAVKGATITTLPASLNYLSGSVTGPIAQAPVSFAGFRVPKQAYISASQTPNLPNDIQGVLGLSFTSLSTVDSTVTMIGGSYGRSFLFNAFATYPKDPNYIAFHLLRSQTVGTHAGGTLTIGEVDPAYASVLKVPAISTFPIKNPTSWTVLLEGYSVAGGAKKSLQSSVHGVPSGKAVANLDTGSSLIYAPPSLAQDVYGKILGAKFDQPNKSWVVPCDTEVNVSFFFSGREYPVHPLDLVIYDPDNADRCIGSIGSRYINGAPDIDILLGDTFLKNVYSVFDFGDFVSPKSEVMGNPYVKLLSITKIAQASTEFRTARPHAGKLIAQANFENGTTTSGSPPSLEDIQKDLESILKYLPAMLAVVALFTMAICIAACVGTVCFLKSRKARGENVAVARNIPGRSQLGNSLPFTNETAKDLNGGSTGSLMSSTSTRGNYAPVSLYNAQAGSLPNHAA